MAIVTLSLLSIMSLHVLGPATSRRAVVANMDIHTRKLSEDRTPSRTNDISIELNENLNNEEDKCAAIMHRFHTNNARYRLSATNAAAPIFINAQFHGQGFGRVLEHTVKTCILGIMLDRPCVVDLSRRDEHYTWRSFVNTGTYDSGVHGRIESHLSNITKAIDQHDGEQCWKEALVDYPDLIPMSKPPNWPELGSHGTCDGLTDECLGSWSAENETVRDKILVSSNWCSNGWFPMLRFPDTFKGCELGKLRTLVQNAMYKPTDLSHNLHNERSTTVLSMSNNGGEQIKYGAIHLRTLFLKDRKQVGVGVNNITLEEEVTRRIASCLRHFDSISKWIIMSDEPNVAKHVSRKLPNVYHGYSDEFVVNNIHSLDAARTLYDHKHMAPSVLDWMLLHKSAMSLVGGHGTAFGETGSLGNEKYRHGFNTAEKRDCSLFGAGYFKAD